MLISIMLILLGGAYSRGYADAYPGTTVELANHALSTPLRYSVGLLLLGLGLGVTIQLLKVYQNGGD